MKTILLVEDDPSIQDALRLIFNTPEFCLIVCDNAEEIFLKNMQIPDIYLVDKQLSGRNGLELCRFLKTNEKTKSIPVIMLSAAPNIRQLAEEAGADDAIEKPFKISQLQEKIFLALS
ncbi:MAG: response regulator [Gammaproteobacteria bacterium]|nr:response regulator [Gammaproteobacteria bacterium]